MGCDRGRGSCDHRLAELIHVQRWTHEHGELAQDRADLRGHQLLEHAVGQIREDHRQPEEIAPGRSDRQEEHHPPVPEVVLVAR
jgi:hypothetical protein